jgi:hypothetical protein
MYPALLPSKPIKIYSKTKNKSLAMEINKLLIWPEEEAYKTKLSKKEAAFSLLNKILQEIFLIT